MGQFNPLVLAYLGDAVYELEVRKFLINQGLHRVKELHGAAIKMVKATTQAQAMHRLMPELDEIESDVVRKGRNAKSGTVPKNTEVIDYRYATAFEALIGYWYLAGRQDKIRWAFEAVREILEQPAGPVS